MFEGAWTKEGKIHVCEIKKGVQLVIEREGGSYVGGVTYAGTMRWLVKEGTGEKRTATTLNQMKSVLEHLKYARWEAVQDE